MSAPKQPRLSWLDYAFGLASRAAKKTLGEMRAEYQAGRDGRPSPQAPKHSPSMPPPQRPTGAPWWEVLQLPQGASLRAASTAYRELIQKNHPDKVAHLSEPIRRVAEQETRRINAAYAEAQRALGER